VAAVLWVRSPRRADEVAVVDPVAEVQTASPR